jgi:hypothetical protein
MPCVLIFTVSIDKDLVSPEITRPDEAPCFTNLHDSCPTNSTAVLNFLLYFLSITRYAFVQKN